MALDMNSGPEPEDLVLEELVRKWKWQRGLAKNRQRQPALTEVVLVPEEDTDDQEERIFLEPNIQRQGAKNFAYRPHEPGFRNRRPPEFTRVPERVNPVIQPGRFLHSTCYICMLNLWKPF